MGKRYIAGDSMPFVRPFNPGERIQNPDGSYSTEVTRTFSMPDGSWIVAPSLYMGPQGVIDLRGDDDAIMNAINYLQISQGYQFPTFKSQKEADLFAKNRTNAGGRGSGPLVKIPGLLGE